MKKEKYLNQKQYQRSGKMNQPDKGQKNSQKVTDGTDFHAGPGRAVMAAGSIPEWCTSRSVCTSQIM